MINISENKKKYHYPQATIVNMNDKLLERTIDVDNIDNKRPLSSDFITQTDNSICGSSRSITSFSTYKHIHEWVHHWYASPAYSKIVTYLPKANIETLAKPKIHTSRLIKLRNQVKAGYFQKNREHPQLEHRY